VIFFDMVTLLLFKNEARHPTLQNERWRAVHRFADRDKEGNRQAEASCAQLAITRAQKPLTRRCAPSLSRAAKPVSLNLQRHVNS